MTKRSVIINTVKDCVIDLMYYHRKEDEELPRGAIEKAIKDGIITKQEIVDVFSNAIEEYLK